MNNPILSRLVTRLLLGFAALLLGSASAVAQVTAARPDRGMMPNGSYAVSDIERINLQNGNVNLEIPLASLPPIAGGKLSWTIKAHYNSKLWDITRSQAIGQAFDLSEHYYEVDTPQINGGWRVSGQYMIEIRDAQDDFDYEMPPEADQDYPLMVNHSWYKVVLLMPDGTEHELRPTDKSPFNGGKEFLYGYYTETPNTEGTMRYYSYDGSYLYAKITSSNDWTVYLPDGTQVIQSANGIQRIQDTNGNRIKIYTDSSGTHYQDEQTGRELVYFYDPSLNGGVGQSKITYRTVENIAKEILINYDSISITGQLYKRNDWKPGQVNPNPCVVQGLINTSLNQVREIVLPQTESGLPSQKFSFEYNSESTESATNGLRLSCMQTSQSYTRDASKGWGAISKMTTPSGAEINYSYALDSGVSSFSHLPFATDEIAAENLTKKTIVQDGPDDEWTYGISESSATQTYLADNSVVEEFRFPSGAWSGTSYGGSTGLAGLVYRVKQPFQIVERHWTNLQFSGAALNSPGGTVTFNPVVDFEYTTLTDASGNALRMSTKSFEYDYNGNQVKTREYDWITPGPGNVSRDVNGVPIGIPSGSTLLREVNNSYYNQGTGAASTNVYAKRSISTVTPLILNALQQTTLGSAITQLSYDGQSYGTAPTVGNVTTKMMWVDLESKWITTSNSYGPYGNLATSSDGRGKATQFFYDDAQLALPTRVVVDPQNGTGSQTTTTAYDFATGLVVSRTDVNSQTSTVDYTNQSLGSVDPFGRPGIVKGPAIGGQQHAVTTTYLDASRQVIVATDLNTPNDKLLKTRTTLDKLGRPILTEQTEDGSNYTISATSTYVDMGRVTLTSGLKRSGSSSTDSWTRVTKDPAGRVTEIASFGGSSQPTSSGSSGVFTGNVTTTYDAEYTTVTDQVGKVRRSKTNSLGQLVRVDEPNSSNSLGSTASPEQASSYAYDVFGNLTTVTQGSQTRSFTYDSLSRLRTAINPENGTNTYQYDDNGNLIVKTDARCVSTNCVSTHYSYDSLNRITRKWYNFSNSPTQTTHNSPALPATVGATDEVNYYYDSQALPSGAPSAPTYLPGKSIGRLVAQTYGGVSSANGDYFAYDELGRPTKKIQQTGSIPYVMSVNYNLSGSVNSLTYPSGNSITHSYDSAARLTGVTGNLGDGTNRNYSTEILYAPTGALVKEKFGTTTPIYNKLFYNSRGQLAEIRESTSYTGPTDTTWDRGAIINFYSDQCWGMCSGASMTDNNGNLQKQAVYIPNETMRWQQYGYDSLNRLQWSSEILDGGSEQWKQTYIYDRWGNRKIDTNSANTYGVGANNQGFALNRAFDVNTANNRLIVPGGQSGAMDYDAAGNLTNDTYTGAGYRKYDAENKVTSAWGGNNQEQLYKYDASGQRIKRTIDGVETWQVYGFGGELLAEYDLNSPAANPQKEYGYRNDQLLVSAEANSGGSRENVALASNGATATASSTLNGTYPASKTNDGNRMSGFWNDAGPANSFPDWLEIAFSASKTIDEVDVITLQDNYNSPSEPTEAMTFSVYGLTGYEVQYWTGSAWATVSGASITGNNKVWKKFTFAPITTTKIRVLANASPDGWSRLVEVEAWETALSSSENVALASNGATATASSIYNGPYPASKTNDGNRALGWWNDAAPGNSFPDWLEVAFSGSKTIDEIDVITLQDNYASPVEPTETMTFAVYGLTGYDVQYWTGSAWATVSGGSITGNNKVWKKFTFSPITTTKIRVLTNASSDGLSRLVEVEAWSTSAGGGSQNVSWGSAVGVSINGSSLSKTSADAWANAGASSTESIASGDGYLELTASETNSYRMIGLSKGDTNQDWTDIDFAAYLNFNSLCVYESGVDRGCWGTFATGDTIRVAVESGVVKYKKNGVIVYTSTVPPSYPLLVDTSLYSNGATINNVVISSGGSGGGSQTSINWLVTDQLGTPRMVFDQSGSFTSVKRHDYLPFGEELFGGSNQNPGPGGRKPSQGYGCDPGQSGCTLDGVRQQFTHKERDIETGLDYFGARYYASTQGRFTSPDEFTGGPHETFGEVLPPTTLLYAEPTDPQSLNKYGYALGNPLRYVDPDGHQTQQSDALIIATPSAQMTAANVVIGIAKEAANTWIGMGNVTRAFSGQSPLPGYAPSNKTQEVSMVVTADVALFAGLLGGKPQVGGVALAEAEQTAVLASEGANQSAMSRGVASEARVLKSIGENANKAKVSSAEGNSIPDFQNRTTIGEIKDTARVANTRQLRIQRDAAKASGREHVLYTGQNTKVSQAAMGGRIIKRRSDLGPQK
jgi:RHS repeat-associated protein